MTQFTTELMQALVKEDISEVFRKHLEKAVNMLFQTKLTFLDYEKYDHLGFIQALEREAGVLFHPYVPKRINDVRNLGSD